jgi:tryptophan-rich sensory protein
MERDAFDLVWTALFILGTLSLPIVIGMVAVLTED